MRIPGLKLDVESGDVPWLTTKVPGISWLPLHTTEREAASSQEPVARSAQDTTALIRMEPGYGYPAHRHLEVEEVLILAGGYRDELGEHGVGSYLRYAAGSLHGPVALGKKELGASRDNPACILFAVARGGVELQPEGEKA